MIGNKLTDPTTEDIQDTTELDTVGLEELKKAAYTNGSDSARKGCLFPSMDFLKEKKFYTDDQAKAYLKGFEESQLGEEKNANVCARRLGTHHASRGILRFTKEDLIQKGFTPDQRKSYNQAFTHSTSKNKNLTNRVNRPSMASTRFPSKNPEVVTDAAQLKKAAKNGADSAKKGCFRPTPTILKERNRYSPQQITEYLRTFDLNTGTEEVQLKRRLVHLAISSVSQRRRCLTQEELVKKNYSPELISYYFDVYKKATLRRNASNAQASHLSSESETEQLPCPVEVNNAVAPELVQSLPNAVEPAVQHLSTSSNNGFFNLYNPQSEAGSWANTLHVVPPPSTEVMSTVQKIRR